VKVIDGIYRPDCRSHTDYDVLKRPNGPARTYIETIETSADTSICASRPNVWLAQATKPVSVA
jgi:hypothetical protein